MVRHRSITTLSHEHVGLAIEVSDRDATLIGKLTDFGASPTHSPNDHPLTWRIEIDGEPYTVSSSATWTRVVRNRAGKTQTPARFE